MAGPLRIELRGAVYHVMARVHHGRTICADDKDRQMWVATLAQAWQRTGWKIHAWVLMGNHYHLLLETPEPNLVPGMKWLQGTNTQRFNARHRKRGHLFQGSHASTYRLNQSITAKLMKLRPRELATLPKGQLEKQGLAWWVYGNTTVRRRWLAERLAMGYETRISRAASYVEGSQSPGVLGLKSTLLRYEK